MMSSILSLKSGLPRPLRDTSRASLPADWGGVFVPAKPFIAKDSRNGAQAQSHRTAVTGDALKTVARSYGLSSAHCRGLAAAATADLSMDGEALG